MTADLGTIPQSNALAEAPIDSVGELLSRSPDTYTPADRSRIVALMREQRERWAKMEGEKSEAKGKPKAVKASLLISKTSADMKDLF